MEDVTKKSEEKVIFKYNTREFEKQDIAYFTYVSQTDSFQDALVGNYDKKGEYVISQEILKTLAKLNKVITKKEANTIYLKAVCNTHEFNFSIKIDSAPKRKKVAQLFLLEKVSVISAKSDQITTPVSAYMDDDDYYFEDKFKKVFNIVPDTEDGKKEENKEIAKAILEKIEFSKKVYKNYLLKTRVKDKLYVEKLIKLLKEDPSAAEALKKYQLLLTKTLATINIKDKDYYRILKQLLDEVLEDERKKLSSNILQIILRMRESYIKVNLPVLEILTTKQAKKINEKLSSGNIKLGKGLGLPSYSYYMGVKNKGGKADKKNTKDYVTPHSSLLGNKAAAIQDDAPPAFDHISRFTGYLQQKNVDKVLEPATTIPADSIPEHLENNTETATNESIFEHGLPNIEPNIERVLTPNAQPKERAKESNKEQESSTTKSFFGKALIKE